MSGLRVAAVQHDIVWEDSAATHAQVGPLVDRAVDAGARLVLLTEMYATGFSMDSERVAEAPDGASATWLVERAAKHDVWMGGSVPMRVPGLEHPANVFVLAAPDGAVHHYAKRHPFSYSGEDQHYSGGTSDVTVVVDGVRVTLTVCYDIRFADQYWRQARDTDLYAVVANWPASRRHHWRSLLVARAIENQAYVVGVNRVGRGGKLDYVGDSLIVDPLGEILADAGSEAGVVTADVDPQTVADVRAKFPFLDDRWR